MTLTPLPPLAADAVHVWRIALNPDDAVVTRLRATLSGDEVERAERFRISMLRRRFVVGRGAMRTVLATYLDVAPERLVFSLGDRGKPRLAGLSGGLEFNLAHTEDLALCAITRGRPVGVDIERLRPVTDAGQIVSRHFTPREQTEFFDHPEPERLAAFFRAWTRKESFLKATGDGLASMLNSFEVTLAAAGPALLSIGNDPEAARRWTLHDLDVGPGYCAALTVAGGTGEVVLRDWAWGLPAES
jgi:4'-phosphopantetheinyl transferase